MNTEQLKLDFKQQLNRQIDTCEETDPKCAHASGMLVILSALRKYDGPTIATQIAVMHSALREIGNERGWGVAKNQ